MSTKTTSSEWQRSCPKCGKVLYYSSKRNLQRAVDNDRPCNTCRVVSEEQKKKISKTLNGRKHDKPYQKHNLPKQYFRECPDCGDLIGYVRKWNYDVAMKNGSVCITCSNYRYKKTWPDVITDDHIKTMRARKAGFNSWDEYVEKYPHKKQYQSEVRRLTYQQPLNELANFELWVSSKGLCGIEGAYQLDHIVSIDEGYATGISPEQIADISNLQIIPWEENRAKSNKLDAEI